MELVRRGGCRHSKESSPRNEAEGRRENEAKKSADYHKRRTNKEKRLHHFTDTPPVSAFVRLCAGYSAIRRDRMKTGGFTLNRVFGYSKLIALTAVIFLLCASVDNIPDCPALLNSSSGPSVSLQLVHHDVVARIQAIHIACETFRPRVIGTHYVSDTSAPAPPSSVPRSLYHAADPSPPSA